MQIPVDSSDLEKILDVLTTACDHHVHRDEMNGALHLAKQVRYSPLTSELLSTKDRVAQLLKSSR